MSKWRTLLVAGLAALIAGCGNAPSVAPAPTTAPPAATPGATSTSAPTDTPPPASPAETATTAPAAAASPTAVEAIAATQPVTSTATPAPGTAGEQDFAPTVRQVWNTAVGLDQMTGNCSKGSLLPVYGLVQITPQGDTLNWKNQEPAPYTFTRLRTNVYRYAGPSAIKDGVVTMTLKFDSAQELEMLRQFTANDDLGCLHTHEYTGTFQWDKP